MLRKPGVDQALLTDWAAWLAVAVKKFGSGGYGNHSSDHTAESISGALSGRNHFFSAALESGSDRGIIVVAHAPWEEQVLGRALAKVSFFGADTPELAVSLATIAVAECRSREVVLVSASPGQSPLFIHAALADAGFHVAAQSLTVSANLEDIAPALARIPIRGVFRTATTADGDAIVNIAGRAFTDSRFMADPHFPKEWASLLMEDWARNLVAGAADEIIVAETGGEVLGFAAMTRDLTGQVPILMGVDPRYSGAGIGAMLVRKMLEWYRERGVRIFTGTAEKSNLAINRMYARIGFAVLDCNLVYHASPALPPLRNKLAEL